MKRSIVAVTLAVVFVLALAAPAFAMTHSATYEMDGEIDFQKQAGHFCNTGAEYKQTIDGSGEMNKEQSLAMSPGLLTLEDANDYVAGETDLTVTSTIELCAPPKYTYEDAVVSPQAMYGNESQPYTYYGADADDGAFGNTGQYTDDANYDNWEVVGDTDRQIWAVQVAADAGYSGNLHQDFTAAYGPYQGNDDTTNDDDGNVIVGDENWAWDDGEVVVGEDYVGNYFAIDQTARTSQGTLQRYIDISSPFNHGYLHEDMSVVGKSDISESFEMENIGPGDEVTGDWWDLF